MDLMTSFVNRVSFALGKGGETAQLGMSTTSLLMVIAALAVWALEFYGRGPSSARSSGHLSVVGCARVFRRLAPELAGCAMFGVSAVVLLRSGSNLGAPAATAQDQQLWRDIQAEWPLLHTADSLLSLQAAARLALSLSALARAKEAGASPLRGEATAFLLLAVACRGALLAFSPADVYHLDGPLGGVLYAGIEATTLVVLTCVAARAVNWSRGSTRVTSASGVCVFVGVMSSVWIATGNRLAIADPEQWYLDAFFSMGLLLESLAAAAFLLRSIGAALDPAPGGDHGDALDGGPFAMFALVVLPTQAALSASFMLTAWGAAPFEPVPELVGAGQPFELLQAAGCGQVALYLLAGVARCALGLALGGPEKAPAQSWLLEV